MYQQVPCHPAMTFSLAKAFAAAGLTALAIRTFERTFQIADAMEEMDSGLRDYYLNESAMHVNDLKTDPEARLHYARTFARVPPALLAVFEVTKASLFNTSGVSPSAATASSSNRRAAAMSPFAYASSA